MMGGKLKKVFTSEAGLCNQHGRIGLEDTAPESVHQAWLENDLDVGGVDQVVMDAQGQVLPSCKKPAKVSVAPYKPPKR